MAPTTTVAPAVTWPLTGVVVADASSYTPRPALVVKIDNGVNSHPQSGLNQADIVFEEIVEGRVTRFGAVFNSMDSDPVGNIRSGRTQDVHLFGGLNDPIFAYSGGNAGVNAALGSSGFVLLTQGDGMFRVDGRGGAPYNLFGEHQRLLPARHAGGAGNATPIFQYLLPGTNRPAGAPVSAVDIGIGSVSVRWDYDAAQSLFLRTQNGDPHQLTDGQVSTNNVRRAGRALPASAADSNSPEAQTIGSGPAFLYVERSEGRGHVEPRDRHRPVHADRRQRRADPAQRRPHVRRAGRRRLVHARGRQLTGGSAAAW